jgi:hypothetical protein
MAINVGSDKARAKIAMGKAFIGKAKEGRGMLGEKISNVNRIKMSKQGLKLLMQGTIERNKKKK